MKSSVSACAAASVALLLTGTTVRAKDIVETATAAGQFATLLRAAQAAGVAGTLKGPGPFTVFAPTDAAFQSLPPGTLERLMRPENRQELAKLLSYHVVTGRLTTAEIRGVVQDGTKKAAVTTVINEPLLLSRQGEALAVNDARIAEPDVRADNGIVQVIDKVLVPATPLQPKH